MRHPFLIGQKVYLRLLEESDINDNYIDWLNDAEVTHYMTTGKYPSTHSDILNYLNRVQGSSTGLIFAIIDINSDRHIGNVTLKDMNMINRSVNTGIMIGDKEFWRRGYAWEAWSLAIEYAFQRLGLRKIIAGVISENAASLSLLKKLGFKVEATLREEFLVDGEFKDAYLLGLFKHEFHKFVPKLSAS